MPCGIDTSVLYEPTGQKVKWSGHYIRQILTAYRSSWRKGYVERLMGSIRGEGLDHLIIINEAHLREILHGYIRHYNPKRTHLGINRGSPETREVQADREIDMLTRELDLRTLPSHGKPRSGGGILSVGTTIYSLGSRLAAS